MADPFFYKLSTDAIIIFLIFLIYAIVIAATNKYIISVFLQSPHSQWKIVDNSIVSLSTGNLVRQQ